MALTPGVPSLAEQERRDRVPGGTYQALAATGALHIAEGLRVPAPAQLVAAAREEWGAFEQVVCDRFRLFELMDVVDGPVVPRVSRWSEAAFDIRSLRKLAKDGPLSVAESSRPLLAAIPVRGDGQRRRSRQHEADEANTEQRGARRRCRGAGAGCGFLCPVPRGPTPAWCAVSRCCMSLNHVKLFVRAAVARVRVGREPFVPARDGDTGKQYGLPVRDRSTPATSRRAPWKRTTNPPLNPSRRHADPYAPDGIQTLCRGCHEVRRHWMRRTATTWFPDIRLERGGRRVNDASFSPSENY